MKTFLKLLVLLGLATYMIFALTLLNTPEEGAVCKSVEVVIDDSLQTGFVTPAGIQRRLTQAKLYPEGCKVDEVDLGRLEKTLTKDPYIDRALCYKTADNRICIHVTPLTPILRILTDTGEDGYLDTKGNMLPRGEYSIDLPIATGHITPEYARKNLTVLGRLLQNDAFWNRQIQQIHVTAKGEVELTPRVGNHIILLGPPTNVREKLARMRTFYTEGLNQVGWNKYATISLKYDNQIICTKHKR